MISSRVIGVDAVAKKLAALPDHIKDEVKRSLVGVCLKLVAKIKSEKLSGQVLNVKTGTLRRSISYQVVDNANELTAQVGSNVAYAAAHEYGFHGTVSVREHLREIKQAFGKSLKEPKTVMVRAHSMRMNIPERSFLRSAIEEMAPEIQQQIAAAVQRGIQR